MVFEPKTHANPLCIAKAFAFFYIGRNRLVCWQGLFCFHPISARSSRHSVALHSVRLTASIYLNIFHSMEMKSGNLTAIERTKNKNIRLVMRSKNIIINGIFPPFFELISVSPFLYVTFLIWLCIGITRHFFAEAIKRDFLLAKPKIDSCHLERSTLKKLQVAPLHKLFLFKK